ncbi:MAG: hypothetical protein HQL73_10465 [Magnetococcales bacterium]|nr:hypothetical protein [Magnetococcales bacterium]
MKIKNRIKPLWAISQPPFFFIHSGDERIRAGAAGGFVGVGVTIDIAVAPALCTGLQTGVGRGHLFAPTFAGLVSDRQAAKAMVGLMTNPVRQRAE